jgi:hypothetical protein
MKKNDVNGTNKITDGTKERAHKFSNFSTQNWQLSKSGFNTEVYVSHVILLITMFSYINLISNALDCFQLVPPVREAKF